MKIIRTFDELKEIEESLVCAIGTFDGIHRGHQLVINEMQKEGNRIGAKSMVITFDEHPMTVIAPRKEITLLMEEDYRCEYLKKMNIDYLFLIHLDERFIQMSSEAFLALLEDSRIQHIFVGTDFTYGKDGLGTPPMMAEYFKNSPVQVHGIQLLTDNGSSSPVISSSTIRQYIRDGRIEEANHMLGRPFGLYGTVIQGDERGRLLGFPTVNFLWPSALTCPPDGVYVNRLFFDDKWYNGIGNIGDNPTFENQFHRFEIHILDFDGDLYGRCMYVEFLTYIRHEVKFESLEALIEQMADDKRRSLAYLKEHGFL